MENYTNIIKNYIGCKIQDILYMSTTMAEAPAPHAESGNSPSVCSDQKAGQSKQPTCILVLCMAGSGKTTFVQVLQTSNDLHS